MNNTRLFDYLIAALWSLSFFFSLPLIHPYELARLASVVLLFSALALVAARGLAPARGLFVPRSPLLVLVAALWLLTGASIFWSRIPSLSIEAFFTFSLFPVSLLIFLFHDGRQKLFRLCTAGAALILGGLALWALAQHFFFPQFLDHGYVRHPFANPNSFAALLALGVFPALGSALSLRNPGARHGAFILAGVFLAALAVIGGRGVFLALVAMSPAFAVLLRRLLRPKKAALVFSALLSVAVLTLLLPTGQGHLFARLTNVGSVLESVQARFALWHGTANLIADHPLAGTGIGTFAFYYPAHRTFGDTVSSGTMAHSDPLQLAAEMGLGATVLFYALATGAATRMRRTLRACPPYSDGRLWPVALFCALGLLALHAHIDFDLYSAPILCLLGLLFAFWHEETGKPLLESRIRLALPFRAGADSTAAWAAVLLPTLALLILAQGVFMGDYHARRATVLALQGDLNGFAAAVNRSASAGFDLSAQPYMLGAAAPLGALESAAFMIPDAEAQKLKQRAEGLLDKAAARNPMLSDIFYMRARLSLYAGTPAEQEKGLLKALALNPQHVQARMMLARLYLRQKKERAAFDTLKAGLPWPVAAGVASSYYTLLAGLAQKMGDEPTAQAALKKRERAAQKYTKKETTYAGRESDAP